ncbi:hypothetical protein BJ170DRAFT_731159 [Xylariales sp. AK1849]|nr:hypothetical protein BJ170DRAFT_731159 [Xylariales sp. AK1849]
MSTKANKSDKVTKATKATKTSKVSTKAGRSTTRIIDRTQALLTWDGEHAFLTWDGELPDNPPYVLSENIIDNALLNGADDGYWPQADFFVQSLKRREGKPQASDKRKRDDDECEEDEAATRASAPLPSSKRLRGKNRSLSESEQKEIKPAKSKQTKETKKTKLTTKGNDESKRVTKVKKQVVKQRDVKYHGPEHQNCPWVPRDMLNASFGDALRENPGLQRAIADAVRQGDYEVFKNPPELSPQEQAWLEDTKHSHVWSKTLFDD